MMSIHEAIFSTLRQPLLGILYLLLTLQMALLFGSYRAGRSRLFRYGCLLHLLISFLVLWFPFIDIDLNYYYTHKPIPLPEARSSFTLLPVWTMFLYEAVSALILLWAFWNMHCWRKEHPTSQSIKETMDLLPAGIAFGKKDGTVVLSNLAMNRISRAVSGKSLSDLNAFQKALKEAEKDRAGQIALEDGSGIWQISSETSVVDDQSYTEMIATDITEQALIAEELEEKNRKLRDIRMRLDIYNRQAARIIIAQELLTARMAVHNEVGNVLLESRRYLKNPASFDEEKLLQALKNTNTYLLREYEQDNTERDCLSDAVEMAEAIGVDILIQGTVPVNDPYRSILASAIGECASNTVKHADGDRLSVKISTEEDEVIYILKSNGENPKEAIHESGGLMSLRCLVENEGGSMNTEISPEFTLTIHLPVSLVKDVQLKIRQ